MTADTDNATTGPTRDELRAQAKALNVPGYSKLSKIDLAAAIASATVPAPGADGELVTDPTVPGPPELKPPAEPPAAPEPSLEELQARAKALDVEGRSSMDRDELVAAIATTEANLPPATPGQASAGGVTANAEHGDELQPGTPEEVGRPDLLEVAQERGQRTPFRELGA